MDDEYGERLDKYPGRSGIDWMEIFTALAHLEHEDPRLVILAELQ